MCNTTCLLPNIAHDDMSPWQADLWHWNTSLILNTSETIPGVPYAQARNICDIEPYCNNLFFALVIKMTHGLFNCIHNVSDVFCSWWNQGSARSTCWTATNKRIREGTFSEHASESTKRTARNERSTYVREYDLEWVKQSFHEPHCVSMMQNYTHTAPASSHRCSCRWQVVVLGGVSDSKGRLVSKICSNRRKVERAGKWA